MTVRPIGDVFKEMFPWPETEEEKERFSQRLRFECRRLEHQLEKAKAAMRRQKGSE